MQTLLLVFRAHPPCLSLVLLLCLGNASVLADPWVSAGDVRARHHLLVLIDHGAINLPVSTWPIMWNDVKQQLDAIDLSHLSDAEVWSYRYLKHELRRAQRGFSSKASLYRANNRSLTPTSNTAKNRSERDLSISLKSNLLAAKVQANMVQYPEGGEEHSADGSFVAASMGDWVLGAGYLERWWGPGWHSSLILSNNARPAKSLFLRHSDSSAFLKPVPLSFSLFASEFEEDSSLPDASVYAARLTIRPVSILEVAYHQLNVSAEQREFKFQAVDWRLGFHLNRIQLALYGQLAQRSEDSLESGIKAELFGLESSFDIYNMHHRFVLETSESETGFNESYDYFGRTPGHMTGDGKADSLLGFHYFQNGHHIDWFATKAELVLPFNGPPQTLEYLQVTYRFPFGDNMLVSLGAMHYREKFRLNGGEYIRPGNFIKLEYAL